MTPPKTSCTCLCAYMYNMSVHMYLSEKKMTKFTRKDKQNLPTRGDHKSLNTPNPSSTS